MSQQIIKLSDNAANRIKEIMSKAETDSIGVACTLTGVVHGIDMQGSPSNLGFTIIDAAGDGIGIFSSRYTHTEYNIGLTQDTRNYLVDELDRSFQ